MVIMFVSVKDMFVVILSFRVSSIGNSKVLFCVDSAFEVKGWLCLWGWDWLFFRFNRSFKMYLVEVVRFSAM